MLICCIVCLHTYKSLALKGIDNRNNMLFTVHLKYKHTQKKKDMRMDFKQRCTISTFHSMIEWKENFPH